MANIKAVRVSELIGIKPDGTLENEKKENFSGRKKAAFAQKLTKIIVSSGEIIDGMEFIYDENERFKCGGNGGSEREISFSDGEYIKKMEWKSLYNSYYGGDVLAEVSFITNKNVYKISAGFAESAEESFSASADEGHEIMAIEGSAERYLNAITKVLARETDLSCSDKDVYYDDYFSLVNASKLTKIVCYSGLVVDKLQFVYDNDEEMTEMHGQGEGMRFEFALDDGEYIIKLKFKTARCSYAGYGQSPVMTSIEFTTNKERSFKKGLYGGDYKDLNENDQKAFSDMDSYTYKMEKDEELFCLAGMYSKYMGRVLVVYKRKIVLRGSLEATQKNTDGKEFLFINHMKRPDGGSIITDKEVYPQVKGFYEYYRGLSDENKSKCKLIPEMTSADDIEKSMAYVRDKTVKDALLSGQYKYISIRSHGTREQCGMLYASLFDVKWVRDNKEKIRRALKNTTVNFFCCECGYRKEYDFIEMGKKFKASGLAREMIMAGTRAVFAYSVVLASWEHPEKNSILKPLMKRFVSNPDKRMIEEKCTPEKAATEIKREYKNLMGLLKENASLQQDVIDEITKKLPSELSEKYPSDFTKDGLIKTGEGIQIYRTKVNERLQEKKVSGNNKTIYSLYSDLFMNDCHFCGPGKASASREKRENNQGELCRDFCNLDDETEL